MYRLHMLALGLNLYVLRCKQLQGIKEIDLQEILTRSSRCIGSAALCK